MKHNEDLLNLFNRISKGEATDEDIRAYNRWCHIFQEKGLPVSDMEGITAEMLTEIKKRIQSQSKSYRLRRWTKVAAAASVILVLAFGGYYLMHKSQPKQVSYDQLNDVAPGGNKATLMLANGQAIILDSAHIGQLIRQGNSKVTKIDSGLLAYHAKGEKRSAKNRVKFNKLIVPRGGQYRLILSDGTKVWLNAASSIQYPTSFTGREREVFITGEVYMEVAEDALHPFIVTTRHSKITVLGTRFNVMAYKNEPAVKTTLLEGSVKISIPGQRATVIKPGQQASIGNTSRHIKVKKVNAVDVAAWVHGLLSLKDYSVREFMNQISRWYDVDIEYAGKIPDKRFGGMISRNTHLSDMLSALKAAGIHTRLEGGKIIVLSH